MMDSVLDRVEDGVVGTCSGYVNVIARGQRLSCLPFQNHNCHFIYLEVSYTLPQCVLLNDDLLCKPYIANNRLSSSKE